MRVSRRFAFLIVSGYMLALIILFCIARWYSHETLYPGGAAIGFTFLFGGLMSRLTQGWYIYIKRYGFNLFQYLLGTSLLFGLMGTVLLLLLNFYVRTGPVATFHFQNLNYSLREYTSSGTGSKREVHHVYEAWVDLQGYVYHLPRYDKVAPPNEVFIDLRKGLLGLWVITDKREIRGGPAALDSTGEPIGSGQ